MGHHGLECSWGLNQRPVLSALTTSTHHRSARSRTAGTPSVGSATSQVSQVWPNRPACRTRVDPSGSRQVWVTLGSPYDGVSVTRHRLVARLDAIVVRAKAASTGRANSQARAEAPSSVPQEQ